MLCPNCEYPYPAKTTEKVRNSDEDETYRRRQCLNCDYVFFTVEFEIEPNDRFKKDWREHKKNYYKRMTY